MPAREILVQGLQGAGHCALRAGAERTRRKLSVMRTHDHGVPRASGLAIARKLAIDGFRLVRRVAPRKRWAERRRSADIRAVMNFVAIRLADLDANSRTAPGNEGEQWPALRLVNNPLGQPDGLLVQHAHARQSKDW